MHELIYKDLVIDEAFSSKDKSIKVLVYAPLAYWTPHFETDLEIAQRHLDSGDIVDILTCDADLQGCQLNPMKDLKYCALCISRNLQGTYLLSGKYNTLQMSNYIKDDNLLLVNLPKLFSSQQNLREFKYDRFDAGMAVLSSVIDFLKTTDIDTIKYSQLIHIHLLSAIRSYLCVCNILKSSDYQRVYIFNGRWSMVRSAVRACEKNRVDYYTHERGSDFKKFSLYKNTIPHDFKYFRQRVQKDWDVYKDNALAVLSGENFFLERRNRHEKSWISFTKEQATGALPYNWDKYKIKVIVYTSTESEYAAISDDKLHCIYINQIEGVQKISYLVSRLIPSAHIWLRVHPNDSTEASKLSWVYCVRNLKNVTLIDASSNIDSYSLLKEAFRVIDFGSTIGVEATFWGAVTISLRQSNYSGLCASYEPESEVELIELLKNNQIKPKARLEATKIGFYLNNFGEKFKYYSNNTGVFDYMYNNTFKNSLLKPSIEILKNELNKLINIKLFSRAIRLCDVYINQRSNDSYGYRMKIICLIFMGEKTNAIIYLKSIEKIDHKLFLDICSSLESDYNLSTQK